MCRSVATPSIGGGTISEADVGGRDICLLRCECHLDRAARPRRRGNPSPPWTCSSPRQLVCDQCVDALCRLLCLAMLDHTVPLCITPLVGQTAARVKGICAFRGDWIAGRT